MDVEKLLRPGGWADRFIRQRSRRLVHRSGLCRTEVDDVAQDFAAAVVRSWPQYSPARSKWSTYVARIVESREVSILRHRGRKKRAGDSRTVPLDAPPCADGDKSHETSDLRLDVATEVNRLTQRQRSVCEALKELSPTEAARALGMHRSTLYEHIATIRQRFDDAGLRAYVHESDRSPRNGVSKSCRNGCNSQ